VPTVGTGPFTYKLFLDNNLVGQSQSNSGSILLPSTISCGALDWYIVVSNSCNTATSAHRTLNVYPAYSGVVVSDTLSFPTQCASTNSSIPSYGAHYYVFYGQFDAYYYFSTNNSNINGWTGCAGGTGWDTWLGVYEANNCAAIVVNDDGANCVNGESYINHWHCPADGYYYLMVRGNGSHNGNYALNYRNDTTAQCPTTDKHHTDIDIAGSWTMGGYYINVRNFIVEAGATLNVDANCHFLDVQADSINILGTISGDAAVVLVVPEALVAIGHGQLLQLIPAVEVIPGMVLAMESGQ